MSTLIIGAGFAGIGAAIGLRARGIDDFVILERDTEIGGTWRDNTYPGAGCDIPSLLYSYSFAPNPDWSRAYSGSSEILSYIASMVDDHGLRPFIRFASTVTGLRFDPHAGVWTATVAGGDDVVARTVITASGPLANASFPNIRGLDDYTGVKMLSSRWDHDYDLSGKRVAVIGTGASAVQIVPEIVRRAATLTVFQRTPGWVLPRLDYATPEWTKALFREVPATQNLARSALFYAHEAVALGVVWNSPLTRVVEQVAKQHLRRQVPDPWMRRQLTPDHRAGCKRLLMSNDYYPALRAPNAKLVTWPIAALSPAGIRTAAGIEHHLDAIVFATGFDVSKTGTPFPIIGEDGRDLDDEWSNGVHAHKSISVAGYPNLFFTFGPNSGPGHNSALFYMEQQIDYATRAIATILERGIRSLDVKEDIQQRHNAKLQQRLAHTTWNSGCSSWYLTDDGFNGTMFPGFATQYARQMADLDLEDYVAIPELPQPTTRRDATHTLANTPA